MAAMLDTSLRAVAGRCKPANTDHRLGSLFVGVSLFVLLIFATATVFVKQAWAIHAFQIGVFVLLAIYLLLSLRAPNHPMPRAAAWWLLASWLVFLIPLWGIVQILAHTTASTYETREAILYWASLAGVFFLVQIVAKTKTACSHLLSAFLWFATLMSVLCLTELHNSNGSVLWLFPTEYSEVFATFPSHNSYAQFVELALPIGLWRAVRSGGRSWGYALASGLLFASVIGAASRVGAILCTVELLAILGYGLIKIANTRSRQSSRNSVAVIVLIPVLASLFTAVVGWEKVWQRLQENDPYIVRREYILSAMEMARHRPLIGYGLGTFPEVYQQYAIKNFPFYANHTHNDWAEFAADGGIPFLLLIFIPCACAVPTALRLPWGLGLPAIMLHACVDFPFPRPAVSAWIFVLLGALYASQRRMLADDRLVDDPLPNAARLSNQSPSQATTAL
jgi:hypothetical protein